MLFPVFVFMSVQLFPVAGAPEYRQPQLAAAHHQLALTFGSGTSIYFTSSTDKGKTFTAPVKVAETPFVALGRHRGPRLALLSNALVISAVTGKYETGKGEPGQNAGNLEVWRSLDQGKTWQKGARINDVPGAAREGLHAMSADTKGNLYAAWLDLRTKGMKLYGAKSSDGGSTWSKNTLIYESPEGTICQCCDPSIAFDTDGSVWAMWRNVIDGSRDLYLAHSGDGIHFEPARKLGNGTWPLNACPMDGGGVIADHGHVATAWRRGSDIYFAEPGKEETRLGTGKDVAIAAGSKGPVVIWSSPKGIEVHSPASAQPRCISAGGAYPNLVEMGNGSVLAAWEENGGIRVELVQ